MIEPIEPTFPFHQRYTIIVHEETTEAWVGYREGVTGHLIYGGGPSTFPKFAWKLAEAKPTETAAQRIARVHDEAMARS
jgi:hypothetical protein